MKKILVLKRGYEYNDNWYSHDGNIEIEKSKIFDTKEEAEIFRKKATFLEINEHPTNGKLRNVINDSNINTDIIKNIIAKYAKHENDSDESYNLTFSSKMLSNNKFKDEIYDLIKELYFTFVEIEVEENSTNFSLNWKSDYDTNYKYNFISDENNNILLHSSTEAAIVQTDDYDVYVEYYLKGKKFNKKTDWLSETRKHKINNVLKNEI